MIVSPLLGAQQQGKKHLLLFDEAYIAGRVSSRNCKMTCKLNKEEEEETQGLYSITNR